MKRGPKSLLTPKLQKRLCDILGDANTIQTAPQLKNVTGKPAKAECTRSVTCRRGAIRNTVRHLHTAAAQFGRL